MGNQCKLIKYTCNTLVATSIPAIAGAWIDWTELNWIILWAYIMQYSSCIYIDLIVAYTDCIMYDCTANQLYWPILSRRMHLVSQV